MVATRQRKPNITLATRARRRTDLFEHSLDDELLLYDPVRQSTHRLNATASFLWQHCDGARDCAALAGELTGVWAVSPTDARRDVCAAIELMVDQRLVLVQESPLALC